MSAVDCLVVLFGVLMAVAAVVTWYQKRTMETVSQMFARENARLRHEVHTLEHVLHAERVMGPFAKVKLPDPAPLKAGVVPRRFAGNRGSAVQVLIVLLATASFMSMSAIFLCAGSYLLSLVCLVLGLLCGGLIHSAAAKGVSE